MKQIETSKGRFVVIDDKKETHYPFHMYIQLYGDNYYKLSEITEDEAKDIVDNYEYPMSRDILGYEDYMNMGFDMKNTAIQSLHSLIESKGIEITNNTYIFKV